MVSNTSSWVLPRSGLSIQSRKSRVASLLFEFAATYQPSPSPVASGVADPSIEGNGMNPDLKVAFWVTSGEIQVPVTRNGDLPLKNSEFASSYAMPLG